MKLLLISYLCGACLAAAAESLVPKVYTTTCDASGIVMLDDQYFAVANDEDNIIRVYDRKVPGTTVKTVDLHSFLELKKKKKEVDFEGAARMGNLVFLIGSHGCNADGKEALERQRLIATEIVKDGGIPVVRPVGKPYKTLLADMFADPRLTRFNLPVASKLAPKLFGALDIEGLAATPEGHLLIGFRNPIPEGKALLVRMLNPLEVIEGKSPKFGEPIQLDLGGRGIRSMDLCGNRYVIIAGSYDSKQNFQMYEWDGKTCQTMNSPDFTGFNPEGLCSIDPEGRKFLIISDDGTRMIDGCECKSLTDGALKRFRLLEWEPPAR